MLLCEITQKLMRKAFEDEAPALETIVNWYAEPSNVVVNTSAMNSVKAASQLLLGTKT